MNDPDLRQAIGACLLGERLGDETGVDVLRVADILMKQLPRMGWHFTRGEHDQQPGGPSDHRHSIHNDGPEEVR